MISTFLLSRRPGQILYECAICRSPTWVFYPGQLCPPCDARELVATAIRTKLTSIDSSKEKK